MKGLFARKPIELIIKEPEYEQHKLKRVLGPWGLVSLGIGVIIGAGIFVLSGQAAATYAGPALVLSFIISAVGCGLAGLCYAEFASMIPISGSAYTYAYATLGEFLAWIIGWDLVLEYLFGASTVAVGWSGYVVSFLKDFDIIIPAFLCQAPFSYSLTDGWNTTGAILNCPAVFIVGLMTTLLVIGIRESTAFNNFIVFIKLTVIVLFIGVGIFFINFANWSPFLPANTGQFGEFGWSGVLRGAGVIFFAFIGFDVVSTAAQEARNPQRDMPIGILGSLAVCTIIFILMTGVLTGIMKYTELAVPDPIAVAVNAAGPGIAWLRPFIKIGAIAGLTSVVLVLLMAQPRVFFSMARDGLLPQKFARVHPRFKTPYIPTILTGCIAAIVSGLFPINILGELVSIGTLLAFAIVCIGVLVLRYRNPDIPRVFRTPWVPFVPVAGALVTLLQMVFLPFDTWIRLLVWMAIGFAIYFFYSRKHSQLRILSPEK
ncbi:MAG TPA: amino acid permease [Smithellaceae bacterium]|nr:amino acid permease [Smithellaceae bacterium]HRY38353.1 amino acid permease [Smithellaceae bacterium]